MRDVLVSLKNKKNWLRVVLSAVIFFAVALPFRSLLNLIPGITEIRPANMIPPVLGLIWGPAAAFGISIGNLISDIVSGSNLFICVTGFIANFFYAYLPYKLWYSFKVMEDDVTPTLGSVKKIIKYVYVILIDSLVVTGVLSFIFETAGFSPSSASYRLLFFNNFDFAVLLGVPVLIFIEKFQIDYYIPQSQRNKKGSYLIYDFLLFAVAISGAVWFVISTLAQDILQQRITLIFLAISIFAMIGYSLKPFNFNNIQQKHASRDVKITIKTKVTIGFMMLAVIFIAFIGVVAYNSQTSHNTLSKWNYVYMVIGIAINITFAVAISFLWYVERNIVIPLEMLSDSAKEFATGHADSNEMLKPNYIRINTGDEISSLAQSFNTMMSDIVEYMTNLKEITAEKERIGAELNVATHIQTSMLPCIFPAFPERDEFDIYASMHAAKEVGGDFYDFFVTDDNHLAVVIADVSGKGVPAALFMVIAKTLIKNHAQAGLNPAKVFEITNNQLCENNDAGMFVTAFMGILEIDSGIFTYVNAGHNPPLVSQGGEAAHWLSSKRGFVLAGFEGTKYHEQKINLNSNDSIFLYTDGVTEALNFQEELYSEKRLIELFSVNKLHMKTPGNALNVVSNDIKKFADGAEQADDITMLMLKLN